MFYAESNRYGLNTTTTIRRMGGKEIIVSAGDLYRFTTKAARDAFVADDSRSNGRATREALTAADARKLHATGDLAAAVWEDANAFGLGDEAGYEKFIEPELKY